MVVVGNGRDINGLILLAKLGVFGSQIVCEIAGEGF